MKVKNLSPALCLVVFVLILSLTACGSGSDSPPPKEPSDTGSISFSVNWENETEETKASAIHPDDPAVKSEGVVDCIARNIDSIEATLYNSSDQHIASAQWACDRHNGVMEGIPAPQDDVTLLLVAKNADGHIIYRGEKDKLSIVPGPANDAGPVDVFSFKPSTIAHGGEPNTFTWNAVTGAEKYRVVISDKEDFSNLVVNDPECSQPNYTPKELDAGALYHVRIHAIDCYGQEGAPSVAGQLNTLALKEVPLNVTAIGDLLKIVVNWEGEAGIKYNVYWSTQPSVTTTSFEGKAEDVEALTWTHENCQGNTAYYYVVTAENSLGQESAVSAEASATAVGAPQSPSDVSAETGERMVTLTWTHVAGYRYNVYWSTEPGVTKTNNQGSALEIDGGTWVHEGCEGVKHYYIVTAINNLGESDVLGEIAAMPGWIELAGSAGYESPVDSAVDADGNVYALCNSGAGFGDEPGKGNFDVLLIKYNSKGVRQWAKLFGTQWTDFAYAIDTDASGSVYVTGLAGADWRVDPPESESPSYQKFIIKIGPNIEDEPQWIKFFDIDDFAQPKTHHFMTLVAVEPDGTFYLSGSNIRDIPEAGSTQELFLEKYDPQGDRLWVRNLATQDEPGGRVVPRAMTLDGHGGVYITGKTDKFIEGSLSDFTGSEDAFIVKYSTDGERKWVNLVGGSHFEQGWSITANQEYCYVGVGATLSVSAGLSVVQFKADNGTHQWNSPIREFEEDIENETIDFFRVALRPNGNLMVGGETELMEFDGQTNAGEPDTEGRFTADGSRDILLMEYDTDGNRLWSRLQGTPNNDHLLSLQVDGEDYLYVIGSTNGDFGDQPNTGGLDILLWKLDIGP